MPQTILETTAYVPWGKLGQIGVLPVFLFHVTSERALPNVGEVAQSAHPFLNPIVNIPDMLYEVCPPRRLVLVAPVALVHIDLVLHMNLLLVRHKVSL